MKLISVRNYKLTRTEIALWEAQDVHTHLSKRLFRSKSPGKKGDGDGDGQGGPSTSGDMGSQGYGTQDWGEQGPSSQLIDETPEGAAGGTGGTRPIVDPLTDPLGDPRANTLADPINDPLADPLPDTPTDRVSGQVRPPIYDNGAPQTGPAQFDPNPNTAPFGLKNAPEKQLYNDMTDRVDDPTFKKITDKDQSLLYTGGKAWGAVDSLAEGLAARLDRPLVEIRYYRNVVREDPVLGEKIKDFNAVNGRQDFKTLPNALASYKMALMIREQPREVHLFFNEKVDVERAVKREWNPGHLYSYELYAITSEGTQVPRIVAWDVDTYQANIGNRDYQPPVIWKAGDGPLGKIPDFTKDPY